MSSPTICIVGAGVIGLSVALYLAQEQNKSNPDNPVEIGTIVLKFQLLTSAYL
jgi:flavin-dependent dehydrogenase